MITPPSSAQRADNEQITGVSIPNYQLKAAILTWYGGCNYGTNLQCFALQHFLKTNYGVSATLIDYRAKPSDYEPKSIRYIFDNFIGRIRTRLHRRKEAKRARCYEEKYKEQYKIKEERCKEFRQSIDFTAPICTDEDWKRVSDEFDVFICGSDQIWNPTLFNRIYFFTKIANDKRKIGYAPSLGTGTLPSYMFQKYREALQYFHAISTREARSAQQLSAALGRKVFHALDPTFLLTKQEWQTFARPDALATGKYLLCYFIAHNEACYRAAEAYAQSHGLKIISLVVGSAGGYGIQGATIDVASGPREFLSLMENASCVMTNSFHCTVFSIIYHKEFFVLSAKNVGAMSNISMRYRDLLSFLQLEDRYLPDHFNQRIQDVRSIDWDDVQQRLDTKRAASIEFLHDSIFA
jgi:hypothetical protein